MNNVESCFLKFSLISGFFALLLCANVSANNSENIAVKVCASCHQADGNSINPAVPKLAGQSQTYLLSQLKNIKNQSRSNEESQKIMRGLLRNLDDQQLDKLANYFSKQAKTPTPMKISATQLALGQEIFEKGITEKSIPACTSCHGQHAEGMGTFPSLAGQHSKYILTQFKSFDHKNRPHWDLMKPIIQKLNSDEAQAVSLYIQSL